MQYYINKPTNRSASQPSTSSCMSAVEGGRGGEWTKKNEGRESPLDKGGEGRGRDKGRRGTR